MTTLGSLTPGQPVNLERSMRADGRFGGHFVQGHADGTGVVDAIRQDGESHWIAVRIQAELEPYLVLKGAIAIDGVSLTVARLEPGMVHVMIIPFTWAHTTLSSLRAGDRVNLECDMVGKYVARSMELAGPKRAHIMTTKEHEASHCEGRPPARAVRGHRGGRGGDPRRAHGRRRRR